MIWIRPEPNKEKLNIRKPHFSVDRMMDRIRQVAFSSVFHQLIAPPRLPHDSPCFRTLLRISDHIKLQNV